MDQSAPAARKSLFHLPRWICAGLGGYAFAGGLLSFLGWACNLPHLTNWARDGISIQPNTTVAAMAAGLALVALSLERCKVAAALGVATGLIGASALFEHATGWSLGIDTLLMFERPWGGLATVAPGRMGIPASISWTLAGAAFLLAQGGTPARRGASRLGLLVMTIAGLSLIGYLFGADRLYSLPRLTAVAFQTATMLFAVGGGLVAAFPDREPLRSLLENSGAGMLARRALPLVIVLPIVLGYLRVRGQQWGLYDTAMGTALLVLTLVVMTSGVLWWGVAAVRTREQSLSSLNEALRRADMALRSASEQFILLDSNWRYAYVNDRVVLATGLSREQLVGKTLWELFPAVGGTELETTARRAMERREPENLEYYYRPWARWFELRIYPTPDGGLALFVLEITERKRAEEALQASDRKKDEFLATLAHELRNPLAPIRAAARIMKLNGPLADPVERQRALIERQAGNMARLLDDLLDVSRITRGAVVLQREPLDCSEVVAHAADACRSLVEARQHELRLRLAGEALPVCADRLRLEQVVMNLLNNAARYTDPGGVITVQTRREGEEAVLSVADTGCGIPPEVLSHVFDLFVQGGVSQDGLGIGLTLVKNLIELQGGRVEARSGGAGQGSEFLVRLPLTLSGPEPSVEGSSPAAAEPQRPASRRVLVVDDNREAADSISELLELSGYELSTAYGGSEGLELVERFRPDVVLLDIGMPGMSGYEVATEIRRRDGGPAVLLIALTGYGQDEDRRRASEAGFDAHLTKPVDPDDLLRLIAGSIRNTASRSN